MPLLDDVKIYCFSGFVKHASLVNAVYPTKAGEEGPRQSQLSYLMYYAQHRTEKLAKVGKYLQRRFTWDAAKDKRAFHRVTLEILNSLIDTCHANLSYFAKPLVGILNAMFDLGDTSLLPELTVTFIKFNTYYDASLDMDDTFAPGFHQLIDRYCLLAMSEVKAEASHRDTRTIQETTLTGLEALKSIALSTFVFKSSKSEKYTAKLIPPLLFNIKVPHAPSSPSFLPAPPPAMSSPTSSGQDHLSSTQRALSPKRPSIFDDVVNDDELTNIALTSLQRLIRNAHASSIAHVAVPIFEFLDSHERWKDVVWTQLLLRKLNGVSNTPTQTALLGQLVNRLNLNHFSHKASILSVFSKVNFDTPCLAISLTDIMDALMTSVNDHPNLVKLCLEWLTQVFLHTPKDFLTLVVTKIRFATLLQSILLVFLAHFSHSATATASPALDDSLASSVDAHWQLDTFTPLFPLLSHPELQVSVRHLLLSTAPGVSPPLPELLPHITTEPDVALLLRHAVKPADQMTCVRSLCAHHPVLGKAYLEKLCQSVPQLSTEVAAKEPPYDLDGIETVLFKNDGAVPALPAETLATQKPRSVFNFPTIERNNVTTEELQAILAGKKVAQRPVSVVGEWSLQSGEYNLDKVLDEV